MVCPLAEGEGESPITGPGFGPRSLVLVPDTCSYLASDTLWQQLATTDRHAWQADDASQANPWPSRAAMIATPAHSTTRRSPATADPSPRDANEPLDEIFATWEKLD